MCNWTGPKWQFIIMEKTWLRSCSLHVEELPSEAGEMALEGLNGREFNGGKYRLSS